MNWVIDMLVGAATISTIVIGCLAFWTVFGNAESVARAISNDVGASSSATATDSEVESKGKPTANTFDPKNRFRTLLGVPSVVYGATTYSLGDVRLISPKEAVADEVQKFWQELLRKRSKAEIFADTSYPREYAEGTFDYATVVSGPISRLMRKR